MSEVDRTTRYRAEQGIYFRLDADGRRAVEQGTAPEKVNVKHRTYVLSYRDSTGRQRWQTVAGGITAARRVRDDLRGRKARHEPVAPPSRLRFGEAADTWLADAVGCVRDEQGRWRPGPTTDPRPATQVIYANAIQNHLAPKDDRGAYLPARWGDRRLDQITVTDAVALVKALRAQGFSEWTIAGITGTASRVFRHAARHQGYSGTNPIALLENGEKAKVSATPERRIYEGDELQQTLQAAPEPWRSLFSLAHATGARLSELLGLTWQDVDLTDPATVRFTHQADRHGERVALKTDASKATLPLTRAAAAMLAEHKARSLHTGAQAFVFSSRTGKALGQRNALRALYGLQERARTPEGLPTFPELFVHDENGHLTVDEHGAYVPNRTPRRDLPPLPDLHAIRHSAAMDCDDAEQARALLRHKNSGVTRTVYRAHFGDREQEALRTALEARAVGAPAPVEPPADPSTAGEVVPMRRTAEGRS